MKRITRVKRIIANKNKQQSIEVIEREMEIVNSSLRNLVSNTEVYDYNFQVSVFTLSADFLQLHKLRHSIS